MELDFSAWPPLVTLGVGALLLVAGRRLFWIAVGVAGFVLGFVLTTRLLGGGEGWLALAAGLACGILGAVLAVLVQKLAVAVAGFLIGGGAAATLATEAFGLAPGAQWLVFIAAGIVAALLAALVFDGALVVLSALLGAAMVSGLLPLPAVQRLLALLALAALGIVVQLAAGRGGRRPMRRRREAEA